MDKLTKYNLPEHTNTLYEKEAISSIGLTHEIAKKINELIDAYNELSKADLEWKQTQEGTIRKGILYMKDNLVNSLHDILRKYDYSMVKDLMLEMYGDELKALNLRQVFITPQMFGARGDGVYNDTLAIERAIATLKEGDVLYFPRGTYLMTGKEVNITVPHVTFMGEGLILCDYGFRPKASHFKALGLRMECVSYSSSHRAFLIDSKDDYIEGFTFKDCSFRNFFYSVCGVGGSYNYDGTEAEKGYPVRDVVVENCYSETYTDNNAGHFQMIQVENISYINNRTYGGQNSSSYNAIKGNGYIRIIGNYDHNNSYASCEVENGSGKAVIANNTFNSKIWVDDSFDVVVNGNTTEGGVYVTVGSNNGNARNVIISGNACKNIRCERFGTYIGGIIQNVNIIGNNVNGDNNHGIWIHGNAVHSAKVSNNFITGTNTNDIAIQRNEELECFVSGNFGNGNPLLISGTGGSVFAVENHNMTVSGNRDSLPASHLERAFNGLKVTDETGEEWRLGINTSGDVFATKY